MRRRPELSVLLPESGITPGVPSTITVVFDSAADTPHDGLSIVCTGHERRNKQPGPAGSADAWTMLEHQRALPTFTVREESGVLTRGEHRRELSVDLPSSMPPSYASELTEIAYALRVHVSIPWWPDLEHDQVINVSAPPLPPERRVWLHASTSPTPRAEELFIQLAVEGPIVEGTPLRGALSFENAAHHRVNVVEVMLEVIETGIVQTTSEATVVDRCTWLVLDRPPADGMPIPLTLEIPSRLSVEFTSAFVRVSHRLRVRADITLGAAVELTLPVRYLPLGTSLVGPDEPLPQRSTPREDAIAAALTAAGVQFERVTTDRDALVVTRSDGRAARFTMEGAPSGMRSRAELSWPSLGLDLTVRPKSILDGGVPFRGLLAFTPRGRSATQLEAVFDDALVEALQRVVLADLSDSGGSVTSRDGELDDAQRFAFLVDALRLEDRFATLYTRVPPPRGFGPMAENYASFATRFGGRFHPGDLSCSGLRVEDLDARVNHAFAGESPLDTFIECDPPAGIAVTYDLTRAVATRLGARVSWRARGACAVQLPFVNDVAALATFVQRFAAALHALVPNTRSGPYR